MSLYLPKSALIKEKIVNEVQSAFAKDLVDCQKRIGIVSDLEKFTNEDYGTWKQMRGDLPEVFSVYFDGQFICSFNSQHPFNIIMLAFWTNLKRLVQEEKIYMNEEDYEHIRLLKEAELKAQQQKIDALPESTEAQRIAKEVIKRVAKKKNGKNTRNV